jgi:hypothetical protein
MTKKKHLMTNSEAFLKPLKPLSYEPNHGIIGSNKYRLYSYACNVHFGLLANCAVISCSRSRRKAAKADKRMVLVHTHGLFIT